MEVSTFLLSILAAILGVYYLLFGRRHYFKDTGIPHLTPLPLLGNLAGSMFQRVPIAEVINEIYNLNRDARYVGLYVMTSPVIMIRDPEIIKSIAVKNFESFPDHETLFTTENDPLVSKNLVALRGSRWREVRALLSPSFTASKMKAMFKLMTSCAHDFTEFLADPAHETSETDMKDAFTRYVNDVIACCAFGLKIDSMRNPQNEFFLYGVENSNPGFKTSLKILLLMTFPKVWTWLGMKVVPAHIANFFTGVITEIVETRERTGITQPDMIQLMMESRGKKEGQQDLSIEDMTSQAFLFFLAGFETSANIMCFAAHEIAVNPDVQERLRQEIEAVLESTGGEVTYETVNGMRYLDAVINEALRMYPPVFAQTRVCEKSFELPPVLPGLTPFVVKEGTAVWFPAYSLQRDPKYFEEPNKFDPDRFLDDESKKNLTSATYIPFGIGPRMCIGNRFALLSIKVLLFHFLAKCTVKVCPKTKVPLKLCKKKAMFADGGFWLKIESRNNHYYDKRT